MPDKRPPPRIWFWGPQQTWNEWRIFRGYAENCNPTICFYTPLGAMIVWIGRRWRTELCDSCLAVEAAEENDA